MRERNYGGKGLGDAELDEAPKPKKDSGAAKPSAPKPQDKK